MKINATLAMLAIGASALGVGCACHRPPPGEQTGNMMGGPGMRGHHPPSPLMQALDANHDGVIDAEEISNAPAALKTLDKNGDGQLTPDELRPPMMMDGPPSAPGKPLPPG
jgi:EF hand